MKTKLQEYMLDFVENELSPAEAASVAAEIRGSAALREELADLTAVRAEIKNADAAAEACRAVNFDKLHAKIMAQINAAQIDAEYAQVKKSKKIYTFHAEVANAHNRTYEL